LGKFGGGGKKGKKMEGFARNQKERKRRSDLPTEKKEEK